jgi:hypothetical protein
VKHLEYLARIGDYSPEQLVFVDESSVDRRTTYRGHAWSIVERKLSKRIFLCMDDSMTVFLSRELHYCAYLVSLL